MRAWHFVGDTLRDGRPVPADGVPLRHYGPLVLCESGLHASLHPFDALRYAPGNTLCLVECGGTVILSDDKLVCSERTIIVRMNATPLLWYFACMQALSVVHLIDNPEDCILDWLMGDQSACSAAWSAAWSAAESAAGSAARSAACSAAWSAAESAVRSGAWSAEELAAWWAAGSAATSAVGSAAWSAAESAVRSGAWSAEESAAWSAAWSAAQSAARSNFSALVHEAFEDWL